MATVDFQHNAVWTHRIAIIRGVIKNIVSKNMDDVLQTTELGDEPELPPDQYNQQYRRYQQTKLCLEYRNMGGFMDMLRSPRPRLFKANYLEMSLEHMKSDYRLARERWEASAAHSDLLNMVRSMNDGSKVPITNVVIFGGGSFVNSFKWYKEQAHYQLAVLNTIRGFHPNAPFLPCIAQDPMYNFADREFLVDQGIEIVNEPAGFAAINEGSLVYLINGPSYEAGTAVSLGKWPATFISQEVDVNGPLPWLRSMVNNCEKRRFPAKDPSKTERSREEASLDGVCIYWRRW